MPELTEEQLAKIYPRAKTYDELQAKSEQRQLGRLPRFAATKVALCTALCIPIIITTFSLTSQVVARFKPGVATFDVLSGVCFGLLAFFGGIALIYYLWYLADTVASKTILATSLLYTSLGGILVIVSVVYYYVLHYRYNLLLTVIGVTLCVFMAAFGLTHFILKKQA